MQTDNVTPIVEELPLVSIIVPIYNVAEFLESAILSIVNQSYRNLEILLVDDGSTDNSNEIAQKFAATDERITVYVKPNGGLSDARNYGLEKAHGEYIYFLDSDDQIETETINKCVTKLHKTNADIVIFDYQQINENGECVDSDYGHGATYKLGDVLTREEALDGVFKLDLVVTAWSYIAKRQLFIDNAIHFSKGRLHEDVNTTPKIMYFANKVAVIDEKLYQYRIRSGSIVSQKRQKNLIDLMWVLTDLKAFFNDKQISPTTMKTFNKFIIDNLQQYLFFVGGTFANEQPQYRVEFFNLIKDSLKSPNAAQLTLKTKVKLKLAKSIFFTNIMNLKLHYKFKG